MNARIIENTHELVYQALEANLMARQSDNHLCYLVYKAIAESKGINIDSINVTTFFLHMKDYGFPSTETIRRTRQKIQASHPYLCADKTVEGQRKANEEIYKAYAVSNPLSAWLEVEQQKRG